jgi:hypothetical protein
MFFTAPADQREDLRVIGDDRFKDEPINISPRQTPFGTLMIIEGDMVVGKREQLLTANLNQLRAEARSLNLSDAGLGRVLSPDQLAIVQALQALPSPGADQENKLQRAVAQSRIPPLVSRTIRLVNSVGDQVDSLPPQLVQTVKNQTQLQRGRLSSVVAIGVRFRWPKGVIPYFYDASSLPLGLPQTIEAAVAHWNQATDRIFLRKTTGNEPYYVEFVGSTGCASNVGKVVQTGPQQIMLGTGCAFDQVVHEIGHAVGLFHEQSRNDRDSFLTIQIQNAIDGTASNFQLPRRGEAQDIGPFDFASVMLYGSDAFSSNGQPTMVVNEQFRAQVGNNWGINHRQDAGLIGLSKGDVAGVAAMYNEPADRNPNLDLNQFVTSAAPGFPPMSGGTRPGQPSAGGQQIQLGSPPVRPGTQPGSGAGQGQNRAGTAPGGQPAATVPPATPPGGGTNRPPATDQPQEVPPAPKAVTPPG